MKGFNLIKRLWCNKIFKIKDKSIKGVHNMDLKVTNNLPNVQVLVNQNADGTVAIILNAKTGKALGEYKPGETVILGEREYIVLGHSGDATALITKDVVKTMEFGKTADYGKSYVRDYCNKEFYKELSSAAGKENIIPHTVNLMCDDGSNKGVVCKDNVSIITLANYRRYREFLPALGKSIWTATGVTVLDKDYSRCVCCVYSLGVPNWNGCGYSGGVRPFCILKSSVLVA